MKLSDSSLLLQASQKPAYWLGGIILGLIALHLQLYWRLIGDLDQVCFSFIAWTALLSMLWKKRDLIYLKSDPISIFFGLFLITLVLVRSANTNKANDILFDIMPMFSGLGVALLAVGAKQIKFYWQELCIVLILALPTAHLLILLDRLFDFSLATAKFSFATLWYLGFEVKRQGVVVMLPTGSIEVNPACSGLAATLLSLKLAFLFLCMFPGKFRDLIVVPLVAVITAFSINGLRVVLMALLVAYSHESEFKYWHEGSGSQIFSLISLALLGGFCQFLLKQRQRELEAKCFEDSDEAQLL